VADTAAFCAQCGARQAGTPVPPADALRGISGRTAALLCYIPIVGWIAAVVVLASQRFKTDRRVRFHAFQGLYLFVAWLIVDWVVAPMMNWMPGYPRKLDDILRLVILFTSVFMLVKASQEEQFRLPIIGELAERSLAEQRL
jgi:uncharacterized membrane protein